MWISFVSLCSNRPELLHYYHALFISRPGSTGLGSLKYLKFHYGSIGESVYCEEYIAGFFSG
jgi:hypothetical protein